MNLHGLPASSLRCTGCGAVLPSAELRPFRCPNRRADDPIDHVLQPSLAMSDALGARLRGDLMATGERHPFRRFRALLHPYLSHRGAGGDDAAYLALVQRLDAAIARVDGMGFHETPLRPWPRQGYTVWIKDETGNVAGSHKARHLFGVLLWILTHHLETERLAIASCGNAALAAAVLARAAQLPLDVYVPAGANPAVVRRLGDLDAFVRTCARGAGAVGDPCVRACRAAVLAGSLPFTCQGPENGLALDGGMTLGLEMILGLEAAGASPEHLLVQVGGGALASATVLALRHAARLGLAARPRRLHTVQTRGAYPLWRAWRAAALRLVGEPRDDAPDTARDVAIAERIKAETPVAAIEAELRAAAASRADYMRPWPEEPRSVAGGILDDETYDWHAVLRGMLETGGAPLVVEEKTLLRAETSAVQETGIPADATGTAGFAGLLALEAAGRLRAGEDAAVFFTGARRDRC